MYCDNDQAADRLAALLMPAPAPGGGAGRAPRCRAALVNERATVSGMARRLRARGVRVVALLSQDVGVDERQMIFCSPAAAARIDARAAAAARADVSGGDAAEPVFPNVPYEEGKAAARARRG